MKFVQLPSPMSDTFQELKLMQSQFPVSHTSSWEVAESSRLMEVFIQTYDVDYVCDINRSKYYSQMSEYQNKTGNLHIIHKPLLNITLLSFKSHLKTQI